MKRVASMSVRQVNALREKRFKVGREKYGDAHMSRYGLLDVLEELLDAQNILDLTSSRIEGSGVVDDQQVFVDISRIYTSIENIINLVKRADEYIPLEACEEKIKRIGFDEKGELDCS